ncbi:FAD dependent oxidoreductase [Grosmannia clavigera kw1407]|uniref:Fumarate reductase n=1 Tax=Grosmannia clavigera (strain kw1407 / UAMH 11150) TaxID=655863 RepID=F0XJX2_GROCL|nr:FAD dependent oxidoreductase [Grosmannia clavigera kw1407]EFX01948.1 FAD dependent oxidoreductase [Grosmannia clavigera kw1407]
MAATTQQPVVIVGAGLAGLCAAWSALSTGASSVVVLERAIKPGGNSMKASSGINGAPTRFQTSAVPDTAFFSDTIMSAGRRLSHSGPEKEWRQRLISQLTNSSAAAVGFLADDIGVDLSVVAQLGGHSRARTHRGAGKTPPGADIVTRLLNKLREDGRFELRTGCEVTRLLTSPSQPQSGSIDVLGVEYRHDAHVTPIVGPVVFATGGFAGDAEGLLGRYRPDLTGLPSTNDPRPGVHDLLANVGARLVDMDSVQVHPTGFIDPANPLLPVKFLAAEMLRGVGAILLRDGHRFVNEMETREHVSHVIMDRLPTNDTPRQWSVQLLLDPGTCKAGASHVAFYLWKGLLVKKKISELDEATRDAVRTYSLAITGQQPDQFGRQTFGQWELKGNEDDFESQEVCVGDVTPITHFTMGGVAIDEMARVLSAPTGSTTWNAVKGLWAAGEVTGGIHGDNRLGGSSLLECVVFGRLAGEQATLSFAKT